MKGLGFFADRCVNWQSPQGYLCKPLLILVYTKELAAHEVDPTDSWRIDRPNKNSGTAREPERTRRMTGIFGITTLAGFRVQIYYRDGLINLVYNGQK